MTALVNDVNALETRFYRSLGDGRGAAKYLAELALDCVTRGDATVVCRAIGRAQSKGDEAAARLVKRVLKALYPDGQMAGTKKHVAFKTSGAEHDGEFLRALRLAGEKDLSIRGSAFTKAVFGSPAKKTPSEKYASAVRTALKAGLTVEAMMEIATAELANAEK